MDPDRNRRNSYGKTHPNKKGGKKSPKGEKGPSILRNIIWGIIVVLAIVLVANGILGLVTRHNREITVPSFAGMAMEQAVIMADSAKVRLDITDSVYMPNIPRGAVYSQNPPAGSRVKKGRRILITQNAKVQKMVEMPEVVGFSLRQAKTVIASSGLQVGKLIYTSDMATNNVLAQQYGSKDIPGGKKVPFDSEIDLVLGLNENDSQTYVPFVIGYDYSVAKNMLLDNSLNVGRVFYDNSVRNYADSSNAVVYGQTPSYSDEVTCSRGAKVNLYLSTDRTKLKNKDGR
ncbi:MAG: PASTA domain-containing protein [Bacteroidales bacterium]|jgi:beta-lactam-binding protein with PASTA domain|nr:PASTA domain-containing protein [Bacteroidales bacterium]MCI2121597.1 PASTA domain-containing protein [Bacteroidales bacterium]MCI2145685.1 PASTA domain-containing protein [Bacteroidales bacterium]